MKYLTFLLATPLLLANTFRLEKTNARFNLKVSHDVVVYESESMSEKWILKDCSRELAKNLNEELFSALPQTENLKGIPFYLDNVRYVLDPKSNLARMAVSMDARMLLFTAMLEKKCP